MHLAASAVVSTSVYLFTKSIVVTGVSFFCGFLLDIDHFLDYVREYGFRVNVKEFSCVFYETRFKKLFLIFHAWEWMAGLLIFAWFSGWNGIFLGLFIGTFHHLVLDQFGNGVTPQGYFFVYRVAKRFSMEDVVPEAEVMKRRIGRHTKS